MLTYFWFVRDETLLRVFTIFKHILLRFSEEYDVFGSYSPALADYGSMCRGCGLFTCHYRLYVYGQGMFVSNNLDTLVTTLSLSFSFSLSLSLSLSQDTSYMFVTGPKVVEVSHKPGSWCVNVVTWLS